LSHLLAVAVPLIALGAALAAAILYARHEARDLRVRRIDLELENLPPAFDGYTIVFASDFHVGRPGEYERKVLDALGAPRGDLLVLGGDYQEQRSKPADGAIEFVGRLALLAPSFTDGIVAVRGNHDNRRMREYLKKEPAIHYLSASWRAIERGGAKIAVAGARHARKKKTEGMRAEARRLAAEIPPEAAFRVLVAHWPDYFPAATEAGFDLVLSGDTHGGQIRLPLVGAPIRKTTMPARYAYGLVRERGSVLYTTSGVGTRGVRLRFLCPPEIVVLKLRRG